MPNRDELDRQWQANESELNRARKTRAYPATAQRSLEAHIEKLQAEQDQLAATICQLDAQQRD